MNNALVAFSSFSAQRITKFDYMSSVNQWRDTDTVITWFKNIKNKGKCVFMQYGIEEYYPSISDLLRKAIDYARTFVDVSDEEEETIMHCRKSMLFNNTEIWVKKDDKKDFDVTMGSFDGTEICELVGLYFLHVLGAKYGKNNHGIYRDDGLA